eukprot:CAMPEP_0198704544 /NCGR_PEP_ID=MMETSP1468-20131203/389960_1 /TAXON_ID=1461545 /ORGANISM="Mantoniella sp, Strain CCMP1436" /LENGTH=90 /DNA_ID=CAMNT_0044463365 /DNA_START=591 /DNA_END=862 /DNA_ORIENTATION=-
MLLRPTSLSDLAVSAPVALERGVGGGGGGGGGGCAWCGGGGGGGGGCAWCGGGDGGFDADCGDVSPGDAPALVIALVQFHRAQTPRFILG